MAHGASTPVWARYSGARQRARGDSAAGFTHAQVSEIQRARILAAMFDVATEQGASNVSVADVVKRSGVSRRTFYEAFTDREDCFLAAFEDALASVSEGVLPAYQAQGRWRERIRAGVIAFLSFLDEEPVMGRLLIVESLSGGPRVLERRNQVLARVVEAIDEGCALKGTSKGRSADEQSVNAAVLPPLTAEGLVGGALSILHARISPEGLPPVIGLANVLTSMIVLPYLGPAAARRELERQVVAPVNDRQNARLLSDPFKDAGMRLTYRTVRVLVAVAQQPSGSNRTIGESAGIKDQGQISKLLARLQRLDLITNSGIAPGQGVPNSWVLTNSGRDLANSITTHINASPQTGDQQ